jgi:REP element-mobilizing transposase RayT
MSQKQLNFQGSVFAQPKQVFGGSLLTSHPKIKRPLKTTLPIHLGLKANQARMRLPKNFKSVHQLIYSTAKKYGIKIYSYANVGNHLHLLIKLSQLNLWAAFIRELTSKIAAVVGPPANGDKFWKYRPFTRIINGWKKAFVTMKNYIYLNKIEAEGHIKRSEVKTLRDLRELIFDG